MIPRTSSRLHKASLPSIGALLFSLIALVPSQASAADTQPETRASKSSSTTSPKSGGTEAFMGVTVHGPDALERAGLIAYLEDRYDDATRAFQSAIEASEKGKGGRATPGLGQQLSNLGWLYYEQGRGSESEALLQRALAADRAAFGASSLNVARRTQELGMLYQAQGKFEDAAPLLEGALALYEKNKRSGSRDLALTRGQIGLNYHARGDLARGEVFLKKALAELETGKPRDRAYWAATMLDLAELYHAGDRDTEAREAFERALKESDAIADLDESALLFNSRSVLISRIESIEETQAVKP